MSIGNRRQGRELALKVIYSLAAEGWDVDVALDDFWAQFRFQDDVLGDPLDEVVRSLPAEIRLFTEERVRGVAAHLARIDTLLGEFSTNWTLERMARVDLALLRLGTFELLNCPEIPTSVVINEAVEIGKRYGTKDTPAFVNGILDKVSRVCRPPSA